MSPDTPQPTPTVTEPTVTTPEPLTEPQKPRRKKLLWVGLAVILIAAISIGTYLLNPGNIFGSTAENAYVTMTANGFSPETIQIKKGQTVEWTNNDTAPHQIGADPYPSHSSLPGFFSERPVAQGETYTYTFEKTGTFTYHDNTKPDSYRGTVIVE